MEFATGRRVLLIMVLVACPFALAAHSLSPVSIAFQRQRHPRPLLTTGS